MRFLVTGGAGFIGSNLIDSLLLHEHAVVCLDNFDDYYDPAIKKKNIRNALSYTNYLLIEGDIRDKQLLKAIFNDNKIDMVIHLAARAGVLPSLENPELYYDVNVTGTLYLLESMRKAGVTKIIFASSSSIYGNNKSVPFSENMVVDQPISPYAASKKAGELMCHTYYHLYGFDVFCLRFFTVYGPRQRPEMAIHYFVRNILNKLPVKQFGNGDSQRDYTYIDDIVSGIWGAIENLKGYEVINLGESQTISLIKLINITESVVGQKAIIQFLPQQPGDVDITYADITKAKKLLGYRPSFSIAKGIELFVEWYKKKSSVIPAISVVMSVYNGEAYLQEAIDSVLSQTFTKFEFIIIDDGSTDNSLSIIKSYNDKRIVFFSQKNTGLPKALNTGIGLAKALLIARMDADDISLPDRLNKQYVFMQQSPECVVCGTWADIIDRNGNYVYTGRTIEDTNEIEKFLVKSISEGLPNTPFFHSSVMFRKIAFDSIGGYNEILRRAQDVELFNRMNKLGDFYNIPVVLLKYRIMPEAIGGNKMAPDLLGEVLIKAIKEEEIDDKLINALQRSLSKSNITEREFNYYLYLAKKYLWNNYEPVKARENLKYAIKIRPYNVSPFMLYLLSFIPGNILYRIHNYSKS